jgi:serine beta-lactamase-like protein LACTB
MTAETLYRHRLSIARLIILGILVISSPLVAQQNIRLSVRQISSIDSTINELMMRTLTPGVSVAVTEDKNIIWSKGYGKADLENDIPAKSNTVYRLASVSKPITAVAIMQLVEQRKIDLDSPIQKYIPSFPKKKYPITTRQLLGHLSGVRHYRGEDEFNMEPFKNLTEGLEVFKSDSLMHKPETQFTYSTYGYVLLGVIIESVSGIDYVDYLKENIFKRCGMNQTYSDEPMEIIRHRARFYDIVDGKMVNARYINSSFRWPGGGLLSTSEDLARFAIALQSGQLVKPLTLREMVTTLKTADGKVTNYGLGWITGLSKYPEAYWHGGIQPGATTALAIIPKKNISVIVLTNIGTIGGAEIDSITGKIVGIVSNK